MSGNGSRKLWILALVAAGLGLSGGPRVATAGYVANAVNDFSATTNPNGPWKYLYDTGTGPQLLTSATAGGGLIGWWSGLPIPNSVQTVKNTTSGTATSGTWVIPTNQLLLDPEVVKSDIVRWTAPSAGTYSISGLFQGDDNGLNHGHTVEILENSSAVLLAPTNISSFGQQVPFSTNVSLAQGNTIDFMVNGATNYNNLGTGLSATITSSVVPEPSAWLLLMVGGAACVPMYWRHRVARERSRALPGMVVSGRVLHRVRRRHQGPDVV
jgi:hypothetical protein